LWPEIESAYICTAPRPRRHFQYRSHANGNILNGRFHRFLSWPATVSDCPADRKPKRRNKLRPADAVAVPALPLAWARDF